VGEVERVDRQFWGLGAPFVHRPPDLLWAAIGLITLVATAALVRRRSLSDVESTVLRLVNGWPGWLFPPMQLLQLGGILVAGPIVAVGAAAFRRYRLALALLLATGLPTSPWTSSVARASAYSSERR
jgi:hypothetical protein